MTHNEFAGYAQFSITQKTISKWAPRRKDLHHISTEAQQDSATLR